MRAPRSYTKEDSVEINCHGGIIPLRDVLELVLKNGARLATPGEFTKRAFLNGRIDLTQAEAVLDIIKAKTDSALEAGLMQLKGRLSQEIARIRRGLLEILSFLEANIDFPEEEIAELNLKKAAGQLKDLEGNIKTMLESFSFGKILREGLKIVICGKPNVGKSSLLNALLKEERSIVTHIAGTTRDTIEEVIDIKGIPVRIVDTAGILEPRDLIEKKAVERSKRYIASADLVLLLFDASNSLSKEDRFLIKRLSKKNVIAILNKIDLRIKIDKEAIFKNFARVIEISAKKFKNLNLLEKEITDLVYHGKLNIRDLVLVTNLRHIELLRKSEKLIARSLKSLDNGLSIEFIAQDLKDVLLFFDELLGKRFSQDLLDKIFSSFCIGK
jgi:tRNA modification GTPase